jgi:hypothetical protein
LKRLLRRYGKGEWRKKKGIASVRLLNGTLHKVEIHWYEAHGIGKKETKIKYFLDWGMKRASRSRVRFVVCIKNKGYEASLERRKFYQLVSDPDTERQGYLRVIDESGEDYGYSADRFLSIAVPKPVKKALLKAAS